MRLPDMPVRRWFAVTLLAIVFLPLIALIAVIIAIFAPTDGPVDPWAETVALIEDNPTRWQDPDWQATLADTAADGDTDVVLRVDGEEVYRTTDHLLTGDRRSAWTFAVPGDASRTVDIYAPAHDGPPEGIQDIAVGIAYLTTLGAVVLSVGWFLRRSIIQPLEAASAATRRVAAGDLHVSLPGSPVREVAALNAAVGSMTDDLRHAQEQRAAMEEERRFLISAIAHDLRTPLFSLRGSLEALGQEFGQAPDKRERYLGIARAKADDLERLIADLFAFTRLEYLGDTPNTVPVAVDAFLEEVVDTVTPRADGAGITVSLSGEGHPVIDVDRHQLGRALGNVLDNALQHTPAGGAVRVSWREDGDAAVITVADSGPGFPEGDVGKVFEPLFRGEASRNRATGGAGLGLTIAQRIVVAHGGTITVRNAVSGGAVIEIRLPVAGKRS